MQGVSIEKEEGLIARLSNINWGLLALIVMITGVGVACLYSAAGGDFHPWASKHIMRFGMGLVILFFVAIINIRWWYKLTWPIYFLGLLPLHS